MIRSRPTNPISARIGELLRVQALLDTPGFTIEDLHAYIIERVESLLPPAYLLYRRRWQALPPDKVPGPLMGYGAWSEVAAQLQGIIDTADLLDEEPEGERVAALQRVLLVEEEAGAGSRT